MRYKGEVLLYNEIVGETIIKATHPSQVVRSMIRHQKKINPDIEMFLMYIANEKGEVWMYRAKKVNGKYEVTPLNRSFNALNRDEIDMVFAMGVPIKNLVY